MHKSRHRKLCGRVNCVNNDRNSILLHSLHCRGEELLSQLNELASLLLITAKIESQDNARIWKSGQGYPAVIAWVLRQAKGW
jgi:hypothetical protein